MRQRLRVVARFAAILVAGQACCAWAGDWPQWRGPAGDGVSQDSETPLVWSEKRGLAWRVDLPGWGDSTPVIWKDAILLTTQDEDQLAVLRLNAADGELVWRQEVGAAETPRTGPPRGPQKFHQLQNNASPSVVTDGEMLVAHFGNGELAAYDMNGQPLWRRNLQADYGPYSIWWGHANSPVLFENLVISVCMQDSLADVGETPAPSYLVAHDKRTGREVWKSSRETGAEAEQGDSYTTPVLYRAADRWELAVMGGNRLDAYDPVTGRLLWYLPGILGGRTITGPTVAHGMVYVTQGAKKNLLAVKAGGEGELTRRAIAWDQTEATPDTCCPVVWGEWLFTISDNGVAKCYNAHTGQVQWKERLPGDYKASPVAAEGRVYFLNTAGLATVVAADNRFEKLASNTLDDETIASPALAAGRLYIRGRKHLYCIEKR